MRPLFEREIELARLDEILTDAEAGRGGLTLVLGEPGIGKTRLVDEVAQRARARGFRVALGRCVAGSAAAYAPWTQALRALVADMESVPSELGMIVPEIPGSASWGDAGDASAVLEQAVARCLRASADIAPRLVVLDDLHDADAASLGLLRSVASMLADVRMSILATQRDVATSLSPANDATLAEIGRHAERIGLRRLSLDVVTEWVERAEPRARAMAAAIHRVTEGNPLFVEEVLRVSLVRGEHEVPLIPRGLRDAIAAHIALADPESRALLSIGAVAGPEISLTVLAAATERSMADLRTCLASALRVGLIFEREDDTLVIGHGLVRDALVEQLGDMERGAAHWRIGRALHAAGERVRGARHMAAGAAAGDVDVLESAARSASEELSARHAWEDVETVLRAAAEASPPDRSATFGLFIDAAAACIRAGALARGRRELEALFDHPLVRADPLLRARAALAYGHELRGALGPPVMVRMAREALAALPDAALGWRARVMARLASALVPGPPEALAEAHRLAMEASALAERLGDDEISYAVLQWVVPAVVFTSDTSERARWVRRWVELARAGGDLVGELRARQFDLLHRIEEGDGSTALAAIEDVVARIGRPYFAWRAPLARAIAMLANGDLETARSEARRMRTLARAAGAPFAHMLHAMLQLSLLHATGDAEAWRGEESDIADLLRGPAPAEYFRALAAVYAGRDAEARACMQTRTPARVLPPSVLLVAGAVACKLADPALAEEVLSLLAPDEARSPFSWGPSGAIALGPVALTLARLARVLERNEEAARWYETTLRRTEHVFPTFRAEAARELAALGVSPAPAVARHDPPAVTPEGEGFRITGFGGAARLDDRRGVRYLARLLAEPGRELHVLDLIGSGIEERPTGAVLDAKAKAAYRARVRDLRAELDEASAHADLGRAERVQAELDAISEQLAQAVGLGGRDRTSGASAERARINVQRRLRDVLARIEAQAPELGRRLAASIRTGTFCIYAPAW